MISTIHNTDHKIRIKDFSREEKSYSQADTVYTGIFLCSLRIGKEYIHALFYSVWMDDIGRCRGHYAISYSKKDPQAMEEIYRVACRANEEHQLPDDLFQFAD